MSEAEKIELFMKPTAVKQVLLYRTIFTELQCEDWAFQQPAKKPEVNLMRMAQILNMNYTTLYHTHRELMRTLSKLTPPDASTRMLYSVNPGAVRFELVKDSVPFLFLRHLLNEDLHQLTAFLAEVDTSRATILRYLRPLRAMASGMNVSLTYETLSVRGDEANIRAFFVLAFWLATDGAAWPFTKVAELEMIGEAGTLSRALNQPTDNPVIQTLLAYGLTITRMRRQHDHYLPGLPAGMDGRAIVPLIQDDFSLDEATRKNEAGFYILMAMFFATPTGIHDPRSTAVLQNLMHYAPGVTNFVIRFISSYLPSVRNDALPLLTAHLTLVALGLINLHFDLSSLVALSFNQRVQSDPMVDAHNQAITDALYTALPVHSPLERAQTKPVISMMSMLSRSFSFSLSQLRHFTRPRRKIKVAVLLEPTVMGFVDLLAFLDKQPLITLTFSDYQHADVIIMDSSLPLALTGEEHPIIFKWQMDASSKMFGDLTSLFYSLQ